ncbi:MAG: phosphatase PAP2 family protein [Bacteroidales bacterium]|nr:phosphatase PAP2 family protein [Bacteroidales bacterium]MBN2750257.1 phosphatase PAP2 family protein [Bacteroidales bacterium]
MNHCLKKTSLLLVIAILVCAQHSLSQEKTFPYKLKLETEIPIIATGLGLTAINRYAIKEPLPLTATQIYDLSASSINGFDRISTKKFSSKAESTSDFARNALFIVPVTLGLKPLLNKEWQQVLTLSVLYMETVYLSREFTALTKNTFKRKRPYLYNQSLTLTQKQELFDEGSPQKSFVSGHTSIAFCSAVFLSTVYTDLYGKSGYSTLIWVSSLSAATLVGYLRIESGMHFPSDVLAGAALGSIIGYAVPRMHKQSSSRVNLTLAGNFAQLTLRF